MFHAINSLISLLMSSFQPRYNWRKFRLCDNSVNLVQKSTFCGIMIRSTFYPSLITSEMMSRKFHASSSMAYLHKCPLNYTLPYGRSNFQSDFFAFLIADSDSLRKTAWRNYLSFSNIPKKRGLNKTKNKKRLRVS